jgi:hypothetical protein
MDKVHETNVIYHCQNVTEKHVPSSYIHSNFFSVFDHLGILSIYTRICFSTVSSVTLSRRFIQFCLCSCVLIFIHCISCFFPISPFVMWSSRVQSLATFEYLISTDPAKINKGYYIFSKLYRDYKCRFHYSEYLTGLKFHLGLLQAQLHFTNQTEIHRCQLNFNLEKL